MSGNNIARSSVEYERTRVRLWVSRLGNKGEEKRKQAGFGPGGFGLFGPKQNKKKKWIFGPVGFLTRKWGPFETWGPHRNFRESG